MVRIASLRRLARVFGGGWMKKSRFARAGQTLLHQRGAGRPASSDLEGSTWWYSRSRLSSLVSRQVMPSDFTKLSSR